MQREAPGYHGLHEQQQQQQQQDTVTTLIVKHAPPSIAGTTDQAIQYFKQYHAVDIRLMQSAAMKGTVFLDFADPAAAAQAYSQLQQLDQYGDAYKKIRVDYAKPSPSSRNTSKTAIGGQQQQQQQHVSGAPSTAELNPTPIAPRLGIEYPANPHLRYRYPDPTPEILNNIMHAIATVPRLYVQTLHLMNKMNLPPPFGPVQTDSIPDSLKAGDKRKHDELVASDESELESDEDEKQKEKNKQATKSKILAAANERKRLFLRNQKR
ncbi:hypothetical protein RO3G_15020 [Lichtheimia corymbifera JMRC:FSU:9682]|uniref:RRM domain-containing protein n=1 Tax=Lichtheimia corymbifera JMRC:FSU:9682 TaxID=1263082 RepID=A0A068RNF7_9FUNG|nr:hypothetical protein RO3G_15020 [Lichtheimia corymbifera JMRC:FSU:9682]